MKICPNCKYKNTEDAHFCENCGHSLENINLDTQIIPSASKQKKSINQHSKIFIALFSVIAAMLIGGLFFGNYYYNYHRQMNRIADAFEAGDSEKLTKMVISGEEDYQISSKKLDRLVDYYQLSSHEKNFTDFIESLRTNQVELQDFNIKQTGRYFGLFKKYQLELLPVYLKISTDQAGTEIFLDGKKQGTSKGDDYLLTLGPLTPGRYELSGRLEGQENQANLDLVRYKNNDFEKNSNVHLDLHRISFKVTSNIDGAQVYLDDEAVATIDEGFAEINDYVWHQGLTLELRYQLDDEELKTSSRRIDDDEYLAEDYEANDLQSMITLDFSEVQTSNDVQNFLTELYDDLSDYTSEYVTFETPQKNDFGKYFVNARENSDEQDFEKFINEIRDDNGRNRVKAQPEVESVTMTLENQYTVQYLIHYDTVFNDRNLDEIKQVFRYKQATLKYNTEDGQLQIDNLGGIENFETVDEGS
ncbi:MULTISPECIES: zinc ribbon domain-containing protein [Enterococcus]|uniref:Zinc-ribbon domain-containing protein n=1 Tax=Enterococcus alishanensis TaxID=1303817 RepID=A0ABS6TFH3_9ENTE|nr:zinc-ribbon domain-containing protein [Enterococcus alishanensis]MBV7391696.1 zinc-ribbon domain-containing protein [Enterococcus alishanensis]